MSEQRPFRKHGEPPRKAKKSKKSDGLNWLMANDKPKPRKNPEKCVELEAQIQFMRLHGDPALTRGEREAVQQSCREQVLRGRSRVHAFTTGKSWLI